MKRIGLLSDTHSYFHPELPRILSACDEIWHAGDFGNYEMVKKLRNIKPLRGVYGNIDGQDVRSEFPEILRFTCEKTDVMIKHIGGYPKRYNPEVKKIMQTHPPKLFISGHSHILKVIFDKQYGCLHLNPGAAGKQGFHKTISILRFTIDHGQIKDLDIVEFDKRELL